MHYYCTICSRVRNCILKTTVSLQNQIFICYTTSKRTNFYTTNIKKTNSMLKDRTLRLIMSNSGKISIAQKHGWINHHDDNASCLT